jgi:hypothetical protein
MDILCLKKGKVGKVIQSTEGIEFELTTTEE